MDTYFRTVNSSAFATTSGRQLLYDTSKVSFYLLFVHERYWLVTVMQTGSFGRQFHCSICIHETRTEIPQILRLFHKSIPTFNHCMFIYFFSILTPTYHGTV